MTNGWKGNDCSLTFPEFIWLWNRQQHLGTPKLHLTMARWLEERWKAGDKELLLMVFRDAGKSTIVGLFCAWLLYCEPNLRIMVLAADMVLAKKMVRNIKKVIELHPLTGGLKPARKEQWAADQFTVRRPLALRDPSVIARSVTSNVTGSRADVVICDDVEVPNTCDTALKREQLRERLAEIEYVMVPGGTQLYVGTPHTYYTIYADQPRREMSETTPFLGGFDRLVLPVVDDKGLSRWPERFSPEKIEAIERRTGPAKFSSQMMLEPRNITDSRLDPDRLKLYHQDLAYLQGNGEARLQIGEKRMVSVSCWWDPSYGAPGAGDASVVAAVFSDQDGGYWLHAVRYLEHDPDKVTEVDEATQMCRQVADFARDYHLPSVTLEINGIGKFLPNLLRRELAEARLPVSVIEHRSTKNKDQRILEAFDAVLAAGALHVHEGVWQTPFITEMREWRPGVNGRDDGLDAVAGCLLNEPVRLNRMNQTARHQDWRSSGQVYTANTDFSV